MEWEAERHSVGFYEKMGGRYVRDSAPGVWGRVSRVRAVERAATNTYVERNGWPP
jgi:hypothetical protein